MANIERKIIISIASEKDALRLSKLAANLFYQTYVGNISSDTLESYIAQDFGMAQQLTELSNPNITTLLVEVENVLVGYAQLRQERIPLVVDVDITAELGRIYIDKSCHGLGIGRKLISRLLKIAREMFHDKMWLGVWDQNQEAIIFYKKLGFNEIGNYEFHIGDEIYNSFVFVGSTSTF